MAAVRIARRGVIQSRPVGGGGPGNFVDAPFSGTPGTLLTAYTVPTGGPVTQHPTTSGASAVITDANRLRSDDSGVTWWLFGATPPTADYTVSADITHIGANFYGYVGLLARTDPTAKTGIEARYNRDADAWDLIEWVSGAFTMLESTVAASGTRLAVVVSGTSVHMALDGVTLGASHTTSIVAAGKVGITFYQGSFDVNGTHISNFTAA